MPTQVLSLNQISPIPTNLSSHSSVAQILHFLRHSSIFFDIFFVFLIIFIDSQISILIIITRHYFRFRHIIGVLNSLKRFGLNWHLFVLYVNSFSNSHRHDYMLLSWLTRPFCHASFHQIEISKV